MKARLDSERLAKWWKNTITFLAPVIIIYLTSVVSNIQTADFSLLDFVPSNFVLGSMTLYLVNVTLDYLKKLK